MRDSGRAALDGRREDAGTRVRAFGAMGIGFLGDRLTQTTKQAAGSTRKSPVETSPGQHAELTCAKSKAAHFSFFRHCFPISSCKIPQPLSLLSSSSFAVCLLSLFQVCAEQPSFLSFVQRKTWTRLDPAGLASLCGKECRDSKPRGQETSTLNRQKSSAIQSEPEVGFLLLSFLSSPLLRSPKGAILIRRGTMQRRVPTIWNVLQVGGMQPPESGMQTGPSVKEGELPSLLHLAR